MDSPETYNRLKNIFQFYIPGSEIDGGEFIEDTKIFKLITNTIISLRPQKFHIEMLSFDFALKMAAIELYSGENRGFYSAQAYRHFFENGIHNMVEDYIFLLNKHGLLPGFQLTNLKLDYEKGILTNIKTKECLLFDTIEKTGLTWLEYELTIKINTIKLVLDRKENRDQIIKLIAGNEKEEYISDATKIFEDIIQL